MNSSLARGPLRLAALGTVLVLLIACGKKDTARVAPPQSTPPAAEAPDPAAPTEAPKPAATTLPAASAAPPPATPSVAAPAAVSKTGHAKPAVSAMFVRAGPLAKARRLAEFVATLRSGETSLKLTLHSGETWTIRQPVDDVDLPDLPQLANASWVHLETPSGGTLVPFAALQGINLAPISADKEKARARVVLQDGTQLTGVVRGRLGGLSELGGFEVPWRALKEIELVGREKSAPAEALPLASRGVALLADGTRLEFTAWATVTGDVVTNVLLAEAGTGPEIVPLEPVGSVEFSGTDDKAFFYQHAISLNAGGAAPVRRNVALTCVLLQQANGCVVCLKPAALQSITRP